MFRTMRRSAQALDEAQCREILACGSCGVLAVCGDGGYPYAVPLSYACEGERIYIHCAPEGHKLDAIAREEKVSFCVVARDDVVPEEYTTRYRSAIAFGRARILTRDKELRAGLMAICRKYAPGQDERSAREIEGALGRVAVVEVTIEHLSGKESRALACMRREQK